MDDPAALPIQSFLAQLARDGASPARLADIQVAAWMEIGAALSPVIGQRGVAALYKRSLHLAAAKHAWLAAAQSNGLVEMDLPALKAAITRQSASDSASAGAALLLSFHALVGSLIGPALSERLLGAVWTHFFSQPAQDPPS